MYCPSCAESNPETNQFCIRCGALLHTSTGGRETASLPPSGVSLASPFASRADAGAAAAPYADFWRRFLAVLIDGVICQILVFVPALVLGLVLGVGLAMAGGSSDAAGQLGGLIGSLMGFVIGWFYEAALISSSRQATLGKMVVGIVVTDMEGRRISFGRATGRYFGKILSGLLLAVGYLIQPFTERRQALHDILAKTLVVRR